MRMILLFLLLVQFNPIYSLEITEIAVFKNKRALYLMNHQNVVKEYKIRLSLAYNSYSFVPGPKRREGDNQTPEGKYYIEQKRRNTNYAKSLLISYPNEDDKKYARENGISLKDIGGMILIHGTPKKVPQEVVDFARDYLWISPDNVEYYARTYFYPRFDWTNGCIAVNDDEMDEIFSLVPLKTPITIYP